MQLAKGCFQCGLRLTSHLDGNGTLYLFNLCQSRLGLGDGGLGLLSGRVEFGRFEFNDDRSRLNRLTFDNWDLAHSARHLCAKFHAMRALDSTAGDDNFG